MASQGNATADAPNVVGLEDRLATTLAETCREVAHAECFDPEQRAEIYTILGILKTDTNAHRETVGRYVSQRDNKDA
jgi:hypothetical protein